MSELAREMRRRDAACVNACCGIATDALELGAVADLLEAAESALIALNQAVLVSNRLPNMYRETRERLRAAIAKARGGE